MKPRSINLPLSGMSPKDIRIAMIQANVTQASIARELGVRGEAVHLIIENKFVSWRIREKIAERIGIDIKRIWPEDRKKPGRQMNS